MRAAAPSAHAAAIRARGSPSASPSPAPSATGPQKPGGRTRRWNASRTACSGGPNTKTAANEHAPPVRTAAPSRNSYCRSGACRLRTHVTASDPTAPAISAWAFTRHQTQRSSTGSPNPEPSAATNFQADSTDEIRVAINTAANANTTDITRPTSTTSRSLQWGRNRARHRSWATYETPQLRCVSIVDMNAASRDASRIPRRPGGSVSAASSG